MSELKAVINASMVIQMPRYIETELGRERLCKHCQEYWPADAEFWYMIKDKLKDGTIVFRPESACKACYDTAYRPNKKKNAYNVKSKYEVAA